MITDLNKSTKTIKLLEKDIGVNNYDLEFGNEFLDRTPEAQVTKEKVNERHQNLKLLCIKEHYHESKKTTYRKGKIFANHVSQNLYIQNI